MGVLTLVGFLGNMDVYESYLGHIVLYTLAYSDDNRLPYPVELLFKKLSRPWILQDLAQQGTELAYGLLQLDTFVPSSKMCIKWCIAFATMS